MKHRIHRCVVSIARLISIAAALIFSQVALAMPTVTGNTISWPNDGWYQVQNVQTFEIVCQGGRSCEVPDGVYWVSRFEFDGSGSTSTRVTVGSPPGPELDNESFKKTLTVDNNTISWSVAGWYQVQDAHTYESLCNGADSCVVKPGSYIVINHSLGLRAEVVVSGDDDDLFPNGIRLIGDALTWPDDGWYQVQNAQTYESICNGGTQCTVTTGEYIVINHSLGIRTRVAVVIDPDDPDREREVPRPIVIKLLGYSCTAEEFFFERPDASENIVGIEVIREGEVIGITEGTSFFTNDRPLGIAQRYDFIAIRADGARSKNSFFGTKARC